MATITFQSSDEKKFTVPLEVATCSNTIKTMLDDLGLEETTDAIPLPNVSGSIMEKVLEWAKHEREEPTGRGKENGNHDNDEDDDDDGFKMNEWEEKYLDIEDETLYALTRAANYLDIKGLLDLCCTAVAKKIRGKKPREIRQHFGLQWPTVEKKNKQQASSSKSSPSA